MLIVIRRKDAISEKVDQNGQASFTPLVALPDDPTSFPK